MMPVQIYRVGGLAELDQRLRQFTLKLQRTMVRRAMRAGARPIQAAARQKAPLGRREYIYGGRRVKSGRKVGQLRRGITVREGRGRQGAEVLMRIGPNARSFYGAFIERGWTPTGPTGKLRKREYITRTHARAYRQQGRQRIPGRPFLEPAAREQMRAAVEAVAASLRQQIGGRI